MNGFTRIMGIVSAFLFGGAALVFFASNLFVAGTTYGIMRDMNEASNPTDPFKGSKLNITNHRMRDSRQFKSGYEALARFSDIEAPRHVSFTAAVPMTQLLKPGETPPKPTMEKVFAQTRAIYYAREECERLLEVLAAECKVENARGRLDDRMVMINAYLSFVQRPEFGDMDRSATLSFESFTNELTARGQKTTLTGAASLRQRIYRKAVEECDAIKAREGNCAITSLSIHSSLNAGAREVTVTGRAEYAFLMELDE